MTLSGKTVVVTGASMGIGAAIAEAFAREGANVVLAARSGEKLAEVAAGLAGSGGRILAVPADVTSDADVARLLQESLTVTGQVDVLVNNAGVGLTGALESLQLDDLRRCLEVNVVAPVRMIQAFLPVMKAAGRGTIVQISSVLGKVSVPYTAGYNASKYALNAITDALRLEAAGSGINVVSVYPGSTESNFRANSLGVPGAPKVRLYRMAPADVARKVVSAVQQGKRDVFITWKDALLCWFATRWPRLADRALLTAYKHKA